MPHLTRNSHVVRSVLIAAIFVVACGWFSSPISAADRKFGQALPWQPHHYGGSHLGHSPGRSFGYGRHLSYGAGYRPFRRYGFAGYGYVGGWVVAPAPLWGYYPNSFYSYYGGPIVLPPVSGDAKSMVRPGPDCQADTA